MYEKFLMKEYVPFAGLLQWLRHKRTSVGRYCLPPPGGGKLLNESQGCSSENLNQTPKEAMRVQIVAGSSYISALKDTTL